MALKNNRSIYVPQDQWDDWMAYKGRKVPMSVWVRTMIEYAMTLNVEVLDDSDEMRCVVKTDAYRSEKPIVFKPRSATR